ncbi:MAG: endopeptidase La [Alphaproteobacteria bacterium]
MKRLIPLLPLRNLVVFPSMVVPLFVGREKSIGALEEVMRSDREILLLTQKAEDIEDPKPDELYQVGTLGNVLQLLRLPDGTVKVLVEGGKRVRVKKFYEGDKFMSAEVMELQEEIKNREELNPLMKTLIEQFQEFFQLGKQIPVELASSIEKMTDPGKLADTIAQNLMIKLSDKQALLEMLVVDERLEKILGYLEGEISMVQVEKKIRSRVKRQMEKTQREYYLNEQMKAIQKELGSGEDGSPKNEIDELKTKAKKLKLPKEAMEKFNAELKKLSMMGAMSSEATVVRNYLDWILALPWSHNSKLSTDLNQAEKILNEDHHGLEKVKERILEYLSVLQRVKKMKGPILCLVGPPGVGKTSLGQSIARATNRQFVRMSLGGVRDEAEIRGHRRTYIGSLPGRILQSMKKASSNNPLFLLDEIDKLGADWRGDPSSALLEVLDPEQNNHFHDHYLELDYDLSQVMFIATANSLRIPPALLDRMEIIRLPGYTEDEKVAIAEKHLLPKIAKDHGFKNNDDKLVKADKVAGADKEKTDVVVDDKSANTTAKPDKKSGAKSKEWSVGEDAVRDLIRYYTREAGVRNLERELQKLARKAMRKIQQEKLPAMMIGANDLENYAGVRQFRFGLAEEKNLIGVVTGLAWTEVGGDILMIESILKPGSGKVSKTGNVGKVMQESVEAAENYLKSRAASFGIDKKTMKKNDVHVHVPEGATPKDGPSAGIAMLTSMVSSLTGIPVKNNVAMTGEITLRGRVLPIGGLKEKLLAALRSGIKIVLIPKENEKDLKELPQVIKDNLKIITVETVDDVLNSALTQKLTPVVWEDKEDDTPIAKPIKEEETEDVVRQ